MGAGRVIRTHEVALNTCFRNLVFTAQGPIHGVKEESAQVGIGKLLGMPQGREEDPGGMAQVAGVSLRPGYRLDLWIGTILRESSPPKVEHRTIRRRQSLQTAQAAARFGIHAALVVNR